MIRRRFRDPSGNAVSVLQYSDTGTGEPIFDAEIVNVGGEVIEYVDRIVGHTALELLIYRRRWEEVSG